MDVRENGSLAVQICGLMRPGCEVSLKTHGGRARARTRPRPASRAAVLLAQPDDDFLPLVHITFREFTELVVGNTQAYRGR